MRLQFKLGLLSFCGWPFTCRSYCEDIKWVQSLGGFSWGIFLVLGCRLGFQSEVLVWGCFLGLHSEVLVWGCHLEVALCGTCLGLSSGGCTLWYSSGVVIWGLHSEVLVWGCHLEVALWGTRLGLLSGGCTLRYSSGVVVWRLIWNFFCTSRLGLSSGVVICWFRSVVIPLWYYSLINSSAVMEDYVNMGQC